ncbi:unnamed protein product [Wuchereria bancrofti]|uniref:Uncharacterized protein n=1 Tax=Wuchereria bancrofti TaxID=6293 RepID=A0A3P7DJY0_WUCBA|nr:unnamed protein product [Wuchereria bancrofti]
MKHHENNIEVLDPNSEFGQCCIDAEKFVHLRFDSFDYLGPHSQQALLIALDQLYAPGSVKIRRSRNNNWSNIVEEEELIEDEFVKSTKETYDGVDSDDFVQQFNYVENVAISAENHRKFKENRT